MSEEPQCKWFSANPADWCPILVERVNENSKLRAQLTAETARLEWLLGEMGAMSQAWLRRHKWFEELSEGQTARDVIDRLLQEEEK